MATNNLPIFLCCRYTILPSGVLHIQQVIPADSGNYRCHAHNLARDRHSAEAELTILPSEYYKYVLILCRWNISRSQW